MHWLEMAERVGKKAKWRQDVPRLLCPWLAQRGPLTITRRDGTTVDNFREWMLEDHCVHIKIKEQEVVSLSKQAPYTALVDTEPPASFEETTFEWSDGFHTVYDLMVQEGFIPEWLKSDEDKAEDNVRFIPFHANSMAIVVTGIENPIIHIMHVYDTAPNIKTFRYVRTFHMPDYLYHNPILCDAEKGVWWIPLKKGHFEVWGAHTPRFKTRTPADRLYPLFLLFEDSINNDYDDELRIEKKKKLLDKFHGYLLCHINERIPFYSYGAETLLHTAVRNCQEDMVERLLALGADPNITDEENGWIPLTLALSREHLNTRKMKSIARKLCPELCPLEW